MLKTYSKMSGSKEKKRDLSNEQKLEKLNADIAEVQPISRRNSVSKKSQSPSTNKKINPGFKRKAKGLTQTDGSDKDLSHSNSEDELEK